MTIATVPDDDINIAPDNGAVPESKPSTAFVGRQRVWLAAGATCPHCKGQLFASDVELDFGQVGFACRCCFRDFLTVRSQL
jgi:hypothetical protein